MNVSANVRQSDQSLVERFDTTLFLRSNQYLHSTVYQSFLIRSFMANYQTINLNNFRELRPNLVEIKHHNEHKIFNHNNLSNVVLNKDDKMFNTMPRSILISFSTFPYSIRFRPHCDSRLVEFDGEEILHVKTYSLSKEVFLAMIDSWFCL